MLVSIKISKEKGNILIRNEQYHINTFGKNLNEALANFREALLLNLEDKKQCIENFPQANHFPNLTISINKAFTFEEVLPRNPISANC